MVALAAMLFTGCSDDFFGSSEQHDSNRIQLSGDIDQIAVTRVNDNGFCNGDVMGVYIVDYDGNTPGTLNQGNTGIRHAVGKRQTDNAGGRSHIGHLSPEEIARFVTSHLTL